MSETAIEWRDVSFSIREGFWMRRKTILEGITLEVPAGSVLGLVGPNGAGKTTTIKLGAGLVEPEAGDVRITGIPACNPEARRKIGFLTETQYIYPHLKLREWLMMLAGFSGLGAQDAGRRISEVLEMLDLKGRENQMIRTLSKGQLQRAGFAQAIIHAPQILFLDEPMSGLDPFWRYRFQKILQELKASGKTILFSSHIIYDVEQLSDRIALIQGGRLKWEGRLSELPRKVKGYEAICETGEPEKIEKLVSKQHLFQFPEGGWRVTLSVEQKDQLLQLVANDGVTLVSLRPLRQEIEEVLFGFDHSSGQHSQKEAKPEQRITKEEEKA